MLDFIRAQGLPVSPYFRTARTAQEVVACVREIAAARESLDFLIDGAVIKIQDSRTRAALGFTDKFPRWAVAFKFPAEETTTTLESVTWELGRTGKLTPLAHLDPVDFYGVTVRKATVSAGAGFVVVLTGEVMTMPGLPKVPAAESIDVDENGKIVGLF